MYTVCQLNRICCSDSLLDLEPSESCDLDIFIMFSVSRTVPQSPERLNYSFFEGIIYVAQGKFRFGLDYAQRKSVVIFLSFSLFFLNFKE